MQGSQTMRTVPFRWNIFALTMVAIMVLGDPALAITPTPSTTPTGDITGDLKVKINDLRCLVLMWRADVTREECVGSDFPCAKANHSCRPGWIKGTDHCLPNCLGEGVAAFEGGFLGNDVDLAGDKNHANLDCVGDLESRLSVTDLVLLRDIILRRPGLDGTILGDCNLDKDGDLVERCPDPAADFSVQSKCDCDDDDPAIYGSSDTKPAHEELCDGKDNDCDGYTDDDDDPDVIAKMDAPLINEVFTPIWIHPETRWSANWAAVCAWAPRRHASAVLQSFVTPRGTRFTRQA